MDSTDKILFELKQLGGEVSQYGFPMSSPYPDSGSFIFKDTYGVIYETSWKITKDIFLDVVVEVKEPRVWGVSYNTGRTVGNDVYITGTITTTRTVLRLINGTWTVVASGSVSRVGEYQSTFVCATPFIDPFVYKLDHSVVDSFSYSTDGGHSWTFDGPEFPSVEHADALPVLEFLFGT